MTKRECAIVSVYTGYAMLTGDDCFLFYEYIAKIVGKPVFSHELAGKDMLNLIREKAKPDFIKLCKEARNEDENRRAFDCIKDYAVSARYVHDWYILCASENCNLVWTDEHIKELCRDFYLIPKEALLEPPEVEVINDEM